MDTLRAFWRWLRTMRTALILLLFLAIGAGIGSLFPQRPIGPDAVARWIADHPRWAGIVEWFGLFDVFGSWWFMGIYGLLVVSLIGCVLPRMRAMVRALRARPRPVGALSAQPQYTSGMVGVAPEDALSGAERVLRNRRFRLARDDGMVAGEKGHLREAGSLLFHAAFLMLLLGMSVHKFFGFTGQVAIVEGERFTDTHVAYDSISEGRLFREAHRGFSLVVDEFDVSFYANGVPREFVSHVEVLEGDRVVRRARIEVNKPLSYRGVQMYQLSWGWAPRLVVRQNGAVLYDGATIFLQRGGVWRGVVKLPSTKPQQVGLDMFFYPDPHTDARGDLFNRSQLARDPVLLIQPYAGNLGLEVPQSIYRLDPTGLSPLGDGAAAGLGETASLPNGITVEVPELKQYTVLQIASNPGAPVLLIAAILILVGLIPALYSSRRRVWVRAAPHNGAVRLEIAGHALQRKAAFEEEFKALVRDLDRDMYAMTGNHDA